MSKKGCACYFVPMTDVDQVSQTDDVNGNTKMELPGRLKERLASLPARRSPESILSREAQVNAKRNALLEAKVLMAKSFGTKKDQETTDFVAETINSPRSPLCIPEHIECHLTPVKESRDTIEKYDAFYAQSDERRAAQVSERVERAHQHIAVVEERMDAKRTTQRFAEIPSYLPENLKTRLASFRARTPEAITRDQELAAVNHKISTLSVVSKMQAESAKVQRAIRSKQDFVDNQVDFSGSAIQIPLPRRLSERLQSLNSKIPASEVLLARCEQAAARREQVLNAHATALRSHQKHVGDLLRTKNTRPRFANVDSLTYLPQRLRNRLASFRVRNAEALLRKEQLIAQRRNVHQMQRVQEAHAHGIQVQQVCASKKSIHENIVIADGAEFQFEAVHIPRSVAARITTRVQRDGATLLKDSADKSANRDNLVAEKSAALSKHNALVASRMQKRRGVQRFTEHAEALPQHLRERLAQYTQRSADAIIRQNERAAVRAKVAQLKKAHNAQVFNARVAVAQEFRETAKNNDVHFFESNNAPVKLPQRLQARIEKLKPSWTAETLLERSESAALRQKQATSEHVKFARVHNLQVDRVLTTSAKTRAQRFDAETFADYLPERLRQRLNSFTRRSADAIMRSHGNAAARRSMRLQGIVQRAQEHDLQVEQVRAVKQLAVDMAIDYSGVASKVEVPAHLQERLTHTERRSAEEIMARFEHATESRQQLLNQVQERNHAHSDMVAERCRDKTTEPRYAMDAYASLPLRLQVRLSNYRKSTEESLKRKENFAYTKAKLAQAAIAANARAHAVEVDNVRAKHYTFTDNMEMMTHECMKPVALPDNLRLRMDAINQAKKTAEQLLEKEKLAHTRRVETLANRRERIANHIRKVNELREQKLYEMRYDEAGLPKEMPQNLKERLMQYRVPTKEVLMAKEDRNKLRHDLIMEARVQSARAHSNHVDQVKATKAEFVSNNVEYGQQEHHEAHLPERLQKRLDELSKYHHSSEETLQREAAATERRNVLLSEKVAQSKRHLDKVSSLMSTKKRLEEENIFFLDRCDEVPETN